VWGNYQLSLLKRDADSVGLLENAQVVVSELVAGS